MRRIAFGLLALCGLACGGFGSEYQVQPADEAMVITAAQVAPLSILGETPSRTKETWGYSKDFAGVWSLDYNYQGELLAVASQLALDPKESDASMAYSALGIGMSLGLAGQSGVELVPGPTPAWGDEQECQYFHSSGVDVGFVCRFREGRRTALYMAVGFLPTGLGAPEVLLESAWKAFQSWDPENTAVKAPENPSK